MVTCLGSLVQLCCGEGGTLQTNITGVCGECLQCMDNTGFAPVHSTWAFPDYTAQAPGCSKGELSKWALCCMHFPGLSCSGSGSWVLHKGTDSVGHAFCAIPRSEELRRPGAWQAHYLRCVVHLITSPVSAAWFLGCTVCSVSPLGG